MKHTIALQKPFLYAKAVQTTHIDAKNPAVKAKLEYAPITKKTVASAEKTPQQAIFFALFNLNPFIYKNIDNSRNTYLPNKYPHNNYPYKCRCRLAYCHILGENCRDLTYFREKHVYLP